MDNERFGEFIAQCRKEQGLSQRQLADKLGVTDKAVSKWERGLGFPDIKTIEPLAEALGVSILEIMQSKRMEEQIPAEDADAALGKVISEAVQQQKIARRNTAIGVLVIFAVVMTVLLIDLMNPAWFLMVCLPIMCGVAGCWLIVVSWIHRMQGRSCKNTLIPGILLLLLTAARTLLLGIEFTDFSWAVANGIYENYITPIAQWALVCLPIVCFVGGISLVVDSWRRHKRDKPFIMSLIAGILLLILFRFSYFIVMCVSFMMGWGPHPN